MYIFILFIKTETTQKQFKCSKTNFKCSVPPLDVTDTQKQSIYKSCISSYRPLLFNVCLYKNLKSFIIKSKVLCLNKMFYLRRLSRCRSH